MKTKKLFLMAAMLLMSVCLFAQNGNTPLKGDVNGDGKVDVADIVAILKIMKDAGGQGESKENTVTFIDRGTVLKTITGQEGTPVTAPSNPTRSGYEFKGWNENESAGVGGQVVTAIGTSDVTYYAQWEEQTTYYWYVGPTDPSTMTSISPIVTDNSSPGWREIGTTLPTSGTVLFDGTGSINVASSKVTQYFAINSTNVNLGFYDSLGNEDTLFATGPTVSSNGWNVYTSNSRSKTFDNVLKIK